MRASTHTATDPGFISLCIKLAQSTFSDVMPSDGGSGKSPAVRREPKASLLTRLDHWFYRQQMNARDAYLAESTDIFDLERRMRHLEQRAYSCY